MNFQSAWIMPIQAFFIWRNGILLALIVYLLNISAQVGTHASKIGGSKY